MKLIAFIVIFYPDNLHFPLGRHSNREMNVIALNVRGFYEYTWKNPINNRSELNISYVTKVGDTWWGEQGSTRPENHWTRYPLFFFGKDLSALA